MPETLIHQRHKASSPLTRPRELVLVVPPLRSNVNLSRIVRTASCCGIKRFIACGNPKIHPKIARDGAETIQLEVRRTLPPVLKTLKSNGYELVALEQTRSSRNLHDFSFKRRTALVVGHERLGIDQESLGLVDVVVEIPVYALPFSYNVATATSMTLYEYCRQFPHG